MPSPPRSAPAPRRLPLASLVPLVPLVPLVLLFPLVLLPTLANATSKDGKIVQKFTTPQKDTWFDRIYGITSNSPTADELRKDTDLAEKLGPVYDLIGNITSIVENRRKRNSEDACSLRHDAVWVTSSRSRVKNFQLDKIDETCLSLIEGELAINEGELDRSFRPRAMHSIREARKALFEATARSSLNTTLRQLKWKKSFMLSGFDQMFFGQNCFSEYVFAYRLNGTWYLRHSVTNHDITDQQKARGRSFTHEHISRNLTALSLPHFDINNKSRLMMASAIMTTWAGSAAVGSVWANYETDEDQALATALRRNGVAIDLAEDSLTPSNIAILALPMVMSFVPVAFLADLDSLGMVIYALLTDVFAAIPFLVKGVELVRSSTNRRVEVNAFYMGNETIAQIEINGSNCTGESKFGNVGWFFVVIAILMMFTGVFLEIFAARYMARRRGCAANSGEPDETVTGPFGAALLESTAQGYMGGEYERAENAYFQRIGKLGLTPQERGWKRWLPGTGLRRRNEQAAGLSSAERMFETGYETESVDYDIAGSRNLPPHSNQ